LVRPEGAAEEGTSHAAFVVIEFAAFPMMVLAGLGAVVSLLFRFRRARGDERQQIKWFATASALSVAFVFAWNFLLDVEGDLLQASLAFVSLILAPAIPVATGIAILKYHLYGIDRIINRTLVYGVLTTTLVLLYFGKRGLLAVRLPCAHRRKIAARRGGFDAGHRRTVQSTAPEYPGFYRPTLLPAQVRRGEDARDLLRQAVGRDRPRSVGRRAGFRWCGIRCSQCTSRSGCVRRVGSEGRKGEAKCEKIYGREAFVTLFVTFGRRLALRIVVKEVR
jgi:hypothetical protein